LCSVDGSCPSEWKNKVDSLLGNTQFEPCPTLNEDSIMIIQPEMVIPVASPNCKYDWNYNFHG